VQVLKLRQQLVKNFICCLFFSRGTPMLLGGDEFLRTQNGNNNSYCQDNSTSWFDWDLAGKNADMIEFVKKAIVFRKTYTILTGRRFFQGGDHADTEIPDILWYGPDMQPLDWNDRQGRTICCLIDSGSEPSPQGKYSLLFVLNADQKAQAVRLPACVHRQWRRIIDTSLESPNDFLNPVQAALCPAAGTYTVQPHSVVVMIGA